MTRAGFVAAFLLAVFAIADAREPQHFVFYGFDRERITEKSFTETPALVGAQLKYRWKELEPARGEYDFSSIRHDLQILKSHKKKLFIQVQDISFVKEFHVVPAYLRNDPEFHGGVVAGYQYTEKEGSPQVFGTWVPRRWDPAVLARFSALIQAIGREFDGKIEGINLAETAIDEPSPTDHWQGWSARVYYESIQSLMRSSRVAFKKSAVLIYANFMPSDPKIAGDGQAYLKGIYKLADEIGIGVGGPDILPKRAMQLKRSLPLIASRAKTTKAGMAVQDGNLADIDKETGKKVTAAELAAYARDPLHLDYMFWGTEEPYWTNEVLPYLKSVTKRKP